MSPSVDRHPEDEPVDFELTGPLPEGTTLLEASAGTGKTFTIAGLVTRYLAEGSATIDQLLVITFTRAASQELRERVRAQLVEAEQALGRGEMVDPDNQVVSLLLDASPAERALRRQRLADALAAFDTATIATTHQFCQQVLASLGVAGDSDPGTRLVEDLDELVVEIADDLYLARYGNLSTPPPFSRDVALFLAREAAVNDPLARLSGAEAPQPAPRTSFAAAVRKEFERRKRLLGVLSYDDLLSRLADALSEPGSLAAARMRRRWRVVLVDEFQDTDPVQWQVIERAFVGHATVVLIGDPKQAIYAFRGGDVATYLSASASADTLATLGVNWRSDEDLLASLRVALDGIELGDERIVVRPVAARHHGSRLTGPASVTAPWRIRVMAREGRQRSSTDLVLTGSARAYIAKDAAADIARLLDSGTTFEGRPIEAGDIAVLVEVRDHGQLVADQLTALGIPAVVAGGGQVFQTRAAEEFVTLLQAIAAPQRAPLVRAAALTSFFGFTAIDLVTRGEHVTDEVADTLRGWGLLLRTRGVAAVMEAADELGLVARVLGLAGGERHLTDLRHLAELMHQAALRDRLGLAGLIDWLYEERRAEAGDRLRRLDSDAAAVQVVTVHGSKGLQYPVVYLPFMHSRWVPEDKTVEVARFHEGGVRSLDLAPGSADWFAHLDAHKREEEGESLRKLYVALTRAHSQVVCWWAPTANTADGPLHRLLFGRRAGQAEVPRRAGVPEDEGAWAKLAGWAEAGAAVVERAEHPQANKRASSAGQRQLERRRFDRLIDTAWRRTSYSGLLRVEEPAAGVASEPEVEALSDEPDAEVEEREIPVVSDLPGVASPMADLPVGATFGSLVHGALEFADPAAVDFAEALREAVVEQLRWWPVDAEAEEIAAGLLPSQLTPLGPIAGGLALAEIPLADRLREWEFEFPLAGGEDAPAAGYPTLRDLAATLAARLHPEDPLIEYPEHLARPPLGDQPLKGYLSGSIDAVLRIPIDGAEIDGAEIDGAEIDGAEIDGAEIDGAEIDGAERATGAGAGEHRYVVVDYKTNVLGDGLAPMTSADYGRSAMAAAMIHSHYPLQALLYSVVLHRYLRWRLPDYDPSRHLGGVAYLFLRGMCGPETPADGGHPTGVFAWQPGADVVVALSDLLAGLGESELGEETDGGLW